MNWTVYKGRVKSIPLEAREDLEKAFLHSREICDTNPSITSLEELLELPMKEFYIYKNDKGDYALVEAKYKPSLKAMDYSAYVKAGTTLKELQSLLDRGRALLARINLERGWTNWYLDFITPKAIEHALPPERVSYKTFKVYDDYYVLYVEFSEEHLKQHIEDFGQGDNYE